MNTALLRARRLTEAAYPLSRGASDILTAAIQSGYGSHEAFARAFRDQFGITPSEFRRRGLTDPKLLLEPLHRNETTLPELERPRIADKPVLLLAGITCRYFDETSARIPAQCELSGPRLASIGALPGAAFGVCYKSDDAGHLDHLTGLEVKGFSRLPEDFTSLRRPAHFRPAHRNGRLRDLDPDQLR